ncbi:MAG: HD domain-containing protein [Candidatus Moraniibacteriota bacterium]
MIYTDKIKRAIRFAIKTHDVYQKQKRKGKDISYITHPLTVGLILSQAGASEDVIVAGILHDTIEDSIEEKKVGEEMLKERFGSRVAKLVLDVSEKDKGLLWEERKKEALRELSDFSRESLLIKSADIVANLNEMLDDYGRYGEVIFERFNGPRDKVIGYKLKSIEVITSRYPGNPLKEDLLDTSERIKEIV